MLGLSHGVKWFESKNNEERGKNDEVNLVKNRKKMLIFLKKNNIFFIFKINKHMK